ncbi:MAG: response regulator [Planctomycetota bacterium]|nr:response regulator [Planctomycetota bacterium]
MSMKILVVDSDLPFLRKTRDLLEPRGHHVVHEADTDDALRRSLKWHPDVIMVSTEYDSCCDGALLGDFSRLRPRPAILLTSEMTDFDRAWRAWRRGGDEVLFKPLLHSSELHTAIMSARQNALCPSRRRAARPLAMSA